MLKLKAISLSGLVLLTVSTGCVQQDQAEPSQVTPQTMPQVSQAPQSQTCFEIDETRGVLIRYSEDCPKDVVIPDSVIHIGEFAFANLGITSVMIPDSVLEISDFAFANNVLKDVTIPNSVVYIGDFAFSNNIIKSFDLSFNTLYIGQYAFSKNCLFDFKSKYLRLNDPVLHESALSDQHREPSLVNGDYKLLPNRRLCPL